MGATSIDIVEGEGPLGATTVVTTNRSGTYKLGSATELTINQSCPGAMRVNRGRLMIAPGEPMSPPTAAAKAPLMPLVLRPSAEMPLNPLWSV